MAAFQSGKKTKAKLPISKHPLFPAMVALWFAALFGLGSLAIRPTLLEKFVLALRLDLVVPAAAPPLGFTSRILLALMMFVIGAAIGFAIARKVARSGGDRGEIRTARASAASFKSGAADDEDFNRLDAAKPAPSYQLPGRRRALAMEEDYVNDYRDHAPLPGHEPQILDLATLGGLAEYTDPEETAVAAPVAESEPLRAAPQKPAFDPWNRHTLDGDHGEQRSADVRTYAEPEETAPAHRAFDTPVAPFGQAEDIAPAQPMDFHRPAFAAPEEAFAEPAAPFAEVAPIAEAVPIAEAGPFEAAPAPRAFDPARQPAPEAAIAPAPSLPAAGLGLMPRDAVEKLTSAPLASLGVVQLAERLALAIARRKAPGEDATEVSLPVTFTSAAPTVPQPESVAVEPQAFAEAAVEAVETASEEVVEAAAAPFAEPAPTPASFIPRAMRPLHFDDSDHDDDDALESILPPRRFAMPAPAASEVPLVAAPAEPEPVAAAPVDEEDENFGSLLGMKPSLRQSFVRVDEPVEPEAPIEPVVIFPGQAPRFASVARPFEGPAQPAPAPAEVESSAPTPIEAGRRFDAPTAMPTSMMSSSASSGSGIDPEETERALKAALATLQRMSGAA